MLRMIDLARALARDPQLLLLDEITAALPSDLAERVFTVMRGWRERGRSVLFITHRLAEVIATCDRATILRDGGAVGDDRPAGGRRGGDRRATCSARRSRRGEPRSRSTHDAEPDSAGAARTRRDRARGRAASRVGARRGRLASRCAPGEILGIAALEGQGQDELFAVLAGAAHARRRRDPRRGASRCARATRTTRSAPGVVLVPADRLQALLPQRSVRENIAAPRYNRLGRWGPINMRDEGRRVREAIDALQIDTRAAAARCAGSPAATSRR